MNVTNQRPVQGSCHEFRKYIGFQITFRSDKPPKTQNFATDHAYVLGFESRSQML